MKPLEVEESCLTGSDPAILDDSGPAAVQAVSAQAPLSLLHNLVCGPCLLGSLLSTQASTWPGEVGWWPVLMLGSQESGMLIFCLNFNGKVKEITMWAHLQM